MSVEPIKFRDVDGDEWTIEPASSFMGADRPRRESISVETMYGGVLVPLDNARELATSILIAANLATHARRRGERDEQAGREGGGE